LFLLKEKTEKRDRLTLHPVRQSIGKTGVALSTWAENEPEASKRVRIVAAMGPRVASQKQGQIEY
jgi:hypothetical protein